MSHWLRLNNRDYKTIFVGRQSDIFPEFRHRPPEICLQTLEDLLSSIGGFPATVFLRVYGSFCLLRIMYYTSWGRWEWSEVRLTDGRALNPHLFLVGRVEVDWKREGF